ncbi:MAG: pyruvoyl-dependent arginine decarboxylase, partial [Chloroflexota bacterium]
FDAALLDAGIGDYNLIKVSSIVPSGIVIYQRNDKGAMQLNLLPKGSFLPIVYSSITSSVEGKIISSAIAIGIPGDQSKSGVIFEANSINEKAISEITAKAMVQEALEVRKVQEARYLVVSSETTVKQHFSCSISAIAFL